MNNGKTYPARFEINQTIYDEDVELADKVSPGYREHSLHLFKRALGYLPDPFVYLPHLALAQSLNENHAKGLIQDETYAVEACALHERIRNDDMKKGGWLRYTEYDESDYEFYNTYRGIYKNAARERLCRLMTYEPLPLYSMTAEVFLRQLFESDQYYADMPMCDVDYKAITITRYREIFITKGEAEADDSTLMGVAYRHLEGNI